MATETKGRISKLALQRRKRVTAKSSMALSRPTSSREDPASVARGPIGPHDLEEAPGVLFAACIIVTNDAVIYRHALHHCLSIIP